jgi:hypothetical protein
MRMCSEGGHAEVLEGYKDSKLYEATLFVVLQTVSSWSPLFVNYIIDSLLSYDSFLN